MTEWIDLAIALMGGLGVGTLISGFLQEQKNRKKFLYEQKLAAYTGYLESLANVISKGSKENKDKVVYWTTRLKLVAPKSVCEIAMKFFDEHSTGQNFIKLREQLVEKMSADLKNTF